MITVKNISGVCKAIKIENGTETVVCTEGQRVPVGLDTYTVGKQNKQMLYFSYKKRGN